MAKVIKDDLPINNLLCTKDGTKIGNALIVGKDYNRGEVSYHCRTDYGSRIVLTRGEIEEFFTTSRGLCDDDHKHRNKFYPGSGYNFGELREEDFINFDPDGQ